jgi:peroxiredoxin
VLSPGVPAPDFTLPTQHRGVCHLADFRGRANVVLAFHPLAFTPVCSTQMQTYERERATLEALDAHVLGISLDAGPSKKAWADAIGGVSFELLSDFHPHGEVSRAYGVFRDDGLVERAVFIVDKAGIIRWAKCYGIDDQPDFQELRRALEAIQ